MDPSGRVGAGGRGRDRRGVLAALFSVALAVAACVPAPATRPATSTAVAASSTMTVLPRSTPPTNPAAATPTIPPPATSTPVPPDLTPATPTVPPSATSLASLSPEVNQAAAAFRADVENWDERSSDQRRAARDDLTRAVAGFAAAGGVGNPALETRLAAALRPVPSGNVALATTVLDADLDGDGRSELLVSVPLPGLSPLLVPGAEAAPRPLLPGDAGNAALDDLTTIQRSLPLDGTPSRRAVLVTRVTRGASAVNTEVLVVGWDGQGSTALFHQAISDWAGPARWQLTSDRQIELTCPAFGVYDHKLLPHPTQVRRFRWDSTAETFALVFRHTDSPASRRELMNLAEADFFASDWDHAVQRYQALLDAPPPTEPGDVVDWVDFARLRLGEIAALRGRSAEASSWLSAAARAAPPLGPTAAAFLAAARDDNAARGFATIQTGDVPARFQSGNVGNLGFPVALGPFAALGPGAAAALDGIANPGGLTPDGVRATLTAQGFVVGDVVVGDLDGDGVPEVGAVLPLGQREADLWLFVRAAGGWRALAVGSAPDGLGGLDPLPLGGRAIQVRTPRGSSEPFIRLGWNGRIVGAAGAEGELDEIATNFLPATGCIVGENVQK